jgi:hypothetical protein
MNKFKKLLVAQAILMSTSAFALEIKQCNAMNAVKKAKANGIESVTNISFLKGVWIVKGKSADGKALVAKVTCIGGDTDNPKVVVQEEPKASLEDILAKVKSTMVSKNYKIKSVKFDGTSWRANILDDDTYIELIFDRGGKLQMKLLSD